MTSDDELTPAERHELDALPREFDPPAGHEDQTVAALRDRGLLGGSLPRRAVWPQWLAAAAAALVLFGGGAAAGRWSGEKIATPQPQPEFILLLRAGSEAPAVEDDRNRVQEYAAWARAAHDQGLLTGEKLSNEARVLGHGGTEVNTAPVAETNIEGYFLLQARSYEEAVAVAAGCPHVKYGGTIEVRRIEHTDDM